MNKKMRFHYAIFIFCAFLTVILYVANIVFTQDQFLYNTICSVLGSERRVLVSGDPAQYERYVSDYGGKAETLAAADDLNERIAEEGIILLKNEGNTLPVKTKESGADKAPRVSVFGHNSVDLVYGGSGSGGSSDENAVTLYESLSAAGYEYNTVLKSFYESSAAGSVRDAPTMGNSLLSGIRTGETPVANYTDAVRASYADYSDFALVVLSRLGGEGFDLPRTMRTSITSDTPTEGARSADDHYLQIDANETAMLREAMDHFETVVLVVNSSEAMELGFLDDPTHPLYTEGYAASDADAERAMNKLKAAVWIGSPGRTGINALGRILNGTVSPSGRTVDTYARDFRADPSFANFGTNNVLHGNEFFTINSKGNPLAREEYLVEYEEGIYVGYRYYETRFVTEGAGGEQWYRTHVVYPFGYGLSYTTFSWELLGDYDDLGIDSGTDVFRLRVRVTNTGDVAGKDVVQVYLHAPYRTGGIEKAEVVLVGFAKTPLLAPHGEDGDSCEVEIEVRGDRFASYDDRDLNQNGFRGYEIEAGDYELRISRDAHTPVETVAVKADRDLRIENDPDTDYPVENRFDDVTDFIGTYLSRADFEGTWPQPPTQEERTVTQAFLDKLSYDGVDEGKKWEASSAPEQSETEMNYDDTVKLCELIGLDYDDPLWDTLLSQLTVGELIGLVGVGNYHSEAIQSIAKPRTIDSDGPVGFTPFMGDPSVYDTCFYVSGCVVGATYNVDLAREFGVMIGNESVVGNEAGDGTPYSGWYAPAVNLHRSPFGGRNWEYYSEDGFLTGKMASAVVQGAKSKGVYCFVKHFALNDQETNRNGVLTFASEQAMRELYFLPFEMTVKEGGTTAMMSSFNRIGTVWTGGSYELLTEVLRGEWGFRGMVVTDYNYATPYMNVNLMIRAGGDLNLTQKGLPDAAETPTQVTSLRRAAKNILYTVANSNAMNGYGPDVIYRYVMPAWEVWLIVIDAVVAAGMAVWTVLLIRTARRRKRRANSTTFEEIKQEEKEETT